MANTVSSRLVGNLAGDLARYEQRVKSEVLFTGVAAMARVIYNEVKLNAAPPRVGQLSGNLAQSIYRVYSPEASSAERKTYKISWNKRTAPHGHLVEFGYYQKYRVVLASNGQWITFKNQPLPVPVQVAAKPFLRPAFDHVGRAINEGKNAMRTKLSSNNLAGEK